jgi:hypothetical protein
MAGSSAYAELPREARIEPERVERAAAPSLFTYAPAVVALAVVLANAGGYADPDLWGHVFFGKLFLANHHELARDPFSYSALGHRWMHHEWMAEAAMAWLWNHFGAPGLRTLKFACSATTIIFVAAAIAETGASTTIQIAVLMITAIAIGPEIQFRPQIFDFVALSAISYALARGTYRGKAPSWVAVPLMALWANLHGGYPIGLAAIFLYGSVIAAREFHQTRSFGRGRTILAIGAIAALATFATPLGIHTWDAAISSLRNPYTHHEMSDWKPLFAGLFGPGALGTRLYYVYALAIMAAAAICVGVAPDMRDLALIAIAALLAMAAFAAVRNISLAAIGVAPVLARHAWLTVSRSKADFEPRASFGRLNNAIMGALALFFAWNVGMFSPRLPTGMAYPAGAVAFMTEHDLRGDVMNDFGWGLYLIWHLHGRVRVFIDGRYDLVYPRRVIEDYYRFISGTSDTSRALAEYPPDYVLVKPDSPAAVYMGGQAHEWALIYRDDTAALFARGGSLPSAIPGAPVLGPAQPQVTYFP